LQFTTAPPPTPDEPDEESLEWFVAEEFGYLGVEFGEDSSGVIRQLIRCPVYYLDDYREVK